MDEFRIRTTHRPSTAADPLPQPTAELISNPRPLDVLLGRGRGNQRHPGNKRLQDIVDIHKTSYFDAQTRQGKVHVARLVVSQVNEEGRFLRYDRRLQGWFEVTEMAARQKVCQAMQYHKRRDISQAESGSELPPVPMQPLEMSLLMPTRNVDPSSLFAGVEHLSDEHEASLVASAAYSGLLAPEDTSSASIAGEGKQGETTEHDSDFMSIIRALSKGAHYRRNSDGDDPGSSPLS